MGIKLTREALAALGRAVSDPEILQALAELPQAATLLHLIQEERDEERAFRRIRAFVHAEAERRKRFEKDLAAQHLEDHERELLTNHPTGRKLLKRLTKGDEAALPPARALLRDISDARRDLGFE